MMMSSGRESRRTLFLYLYVLVFVFAGGSVGSVVGSPLSPERYQVTAFGAERRARWSLEGKTAIVTGGTKVRQM